MTGKEFQRLIREYLLPKIDGFAVKGGLLFETQIQYVLKGYCFEPSGWSRQDFYLTMLVQPLFVPKTGIVFSIGDRLNPGMTISDENESEVMAEVAKQIRKKGAPFLRRFDTLSDLTYGVVKYHLNKHDIYAPEMAAYGAILLGDKKYAMKMFQCAEDRFNMDDDRRQWVLDVMDRIHSMRRLFESDPPGAVSKLKRWREETAANLKLTKFLAPV